jgi:hypothetical protein
MTESPSNKPCRVGLFTAEVQSEQAVRDLLAGGFSKDQLAVIYPRGKNNRVSSEVPRAEPPGSHPAATLVEGGAVGAVLGGIALAATAIATGGIGILPAIPLLVGGGAVAGMFGNAVLSDGYGKGVGEYYGEAIHQGKIVVGVEVEGEDAPARLADAERILVAAGGEVPALTTSK